MNYKIQSINEGQQWDLLPEADPNFSLLASETQENIRLYFCFLQKFSKDFIHLSKGKFKPYCNCRNG